MSPDSSIESKENTLHSMDHDIENPGKKEPELVVTGQVHDFPDGGFRAWSVAVGAAGILFCTFGFANSFGVFQEYYQYHQLSSETSSAISWIGSLQTFLLFLGNVFGGPLFDRYGTATIWPSVIAYLIGVFMTSLCSSYYQFMLAQGVLCGVAMGMSMAPTMAATGQYFHKNRGAAMGVALGGSSLGGVIFPIALARLLTYENLGFGWTIRILGFIITAVIIPSTLAIRPRLPPRKGTFFIMSAFTEKKFVLLVLSLSPMIMGLFMPMFFLPVFALSKGMTVELSSYLPAILNGASFFGRVIPGAMGDKLGRLNVLCAAGIFTGILILCMPALSSDASFIVFSIIYGFTSGAIISGMSVCIAQVPSSPKNIGTYMGMAFGVVSIFVLIGPPIDGVFISHYAGYTQLAIFCGVIVIAGGLGVIGIKAVDDKGIWAKN